MCLILIHCRLQWSHITHLKNKNKFLLLYKYWSFAESLMNINLHLKKNMRLTKKNMHLIKISSTNQFL